MTDAIATGAVLKERYRLERLLGRGGMASVWLGHDDVLDRPVAIKVLSDTIASDPEFLARFRREAKVAAGLSHPNLVGVYDYAEGDERPYLVMEFVPGDDLGSHISRHSRVDCGRLARELLDAVAHIHAVGIVHRDIKPHNIVIAPDGTAKLIDFGIALPRDATSLTQTGLILGTKRYAAPEVMEGLPATERSDLYSCGVVLRSCLGEGGAPVLGSLVNWLTSADPRNRPASARQALAQLEGQVVAGQPTEAFSPTFARPPERPSSRRTRQPLESTTRRLDPPPASRRKRWGATAAILAVLAALAAVVLVSGNASDETAGGARSGGAKSSQGAVAAQTTASSPAADQAQTTEATEAEAPAAAAPAPAGDDPALGSALNQEGFELIQAGRYEEAIPVLEESVRAFPPGTEEADYAYALFNLGNALRLGGRAEEAIPVLERRLEIPNQTEVVRRELDAARQEAG
ncbi:MAG TPA: serine/threonine-protein kinase [Solirubrobacterales bacterium]|nr:serine/threonine-protein kinase [Solirubrobacterales bacterium]